MWKDWAHARRKSPSERRQEETVYPGIICTVAQNLDQVLEQSKFDEVVIVFFFSSQHHFTSPGHTNPLLTQRAGAVALEYGHRMIPQSPYSGKADSRSQLKRIGVREEEFDDSTRRAVYLRDKWFAETTRPRVATNAVEC